LFAPPVTDRYNILDKFTVDLIILDSPVPIQIKTFGWKTGEPDSNSDDVGGFFYFSPVFIVALWRNQSRIQWKNLDISATEKRLRYAGKK